MLETRTTVPHSDVMLGFSSLRSQCAIGPGEIGWFIYGPFYGYVVRLASLAINKGRVYRGSYSLIRFEFFYQRTMKTVVNYTAACHEW